MQNILSVDNHSVAVGLLTGDPILDAGSRGLRFSKWFATRGHRVIALDPGESETCDGVESYKLALYHRNDAELRLILTDDKEARYVLDKDRHSGETYIPVRAVTMQELMERVAGVGRWDVVKLNIEGAEYGILDSWPGPISRQIVFSFHEHTDRARGRKECDRIIDRLREWYDIHNQVWEQRYGCRENYWDVLAIERGLNA